jgi:methylenetetrahydrofolate dehydrogenase (NADP+)/methenyltetrahydrofolate cyclohydrolase
MSANIIDGRALAKKIRKELKKDVEQLAETGIVPNLQVILVGENPASKVYVRSKARTAKKLGIKSDTITMPDSITQEELLAKIYELNADEDVNGILVQLPLPDQIDEQAIIEAIDPEKDVDGFHPINLGRMVAGIPLFLPCTPHGIQKLIVEYDGDPSGKHVVVLGRSNIVGKPIANMLMQKADGANATITVCHSRTQNLTEITRQADILIAAIGRATFVTADMVKDGVVVIDVGINRLDDGSLVGDVDFDPVSEKASAITPVPGGVGPMTIAMLMWNTVKAAKLQAGI